MRHCIAQMLRQLASWVQVVELFTAAMAPDSNSPLADRATIANMSPGYEVALPAALRFPVDASQPHQLPYASGRPRLVNELALGVGGLCQSAGECGVRRAMSRSLPVAVSVADMGTVAAAGLARPKQPQDRVALGMSEAALPPAAAGWRST